MTSHKARHNPMSSYEDMQALLKSNDDYEDEDDDDVFVSSKYASRPSSGGINWGDRTGKKEPTGGTRNYGSSSASSRVSKKTVSYADVLARKKKEKSINDAFKIDWSSFGTSSLW